MNLLYSSPEQWAPFFLQENKVKITTSVFALALAFASFAASPAFAENREVEIVNETSRSMVRFHASNVGTDKWEENIFHGRPLRPGDSATVDIDDGQGWCKFDLKAVFSDGTVLRRYNVNVCSVTSWTITE